MEKYELETLYSKKEKNYFTFNHVVSTYAIFLQQIKAFIWKKVFYSFSAHQHFRRFIFRTTRAIQNFAQSWGRASVVCEAPLQNYMIYSVWSIWPV